MASLLGAALGCAHGAADTPAWRARPAQAQAHLYYYGDDRGLSVITTGLEAEQPISAQTSVMARGLVDRIVVEHERAFVEDVGAGPTGHTHDDVDVVTSASVSVAGGDRLEKYRFEGTAGVLHALDNPETPTRLQGYVRASTEPDYRSYSGRLGVETELLQRNLSLSAFAGYGHDTVDPLEAPPGEARDWPATHQRWNLGGSASQILSRRLILYGGLAISHQFGTLSNPYRRAVVRTTLFPERLPEARVRGTAFARLSWYLGWTTALHLRQGVYADDWGVKSVIPETAVVKELGEDGLISLRYRFYWQTAASFYQRRYQELEPLRTGDARLGAVHSHQPGVELSWTVLGRQGDFGSMTLLGEYKLVLLEYEALVDGAVTAHIGHFALSGSF